MTLSRFLVCAAAASIALGGAWSASAQAPASLAGCADDVRQNATRDSISYQYRGKTIPALIYKPRPGAENGVGIVLLHGFTGLGGHGPLFDPHAIQLASRGYTVLMPSYFDARQWRQRFDGDDVKEWSQASAEAVKFLASQPGVDPAKVVLWGYSLGGYIATDGSLTDYGTAAGAVGVSAGTDIFNNASRGSRAIPVLLMHGRSDRSVSVRSMEALARNLSVRGATVETELLDRQQHELDAPTWCHVFGRTREFLEVHFLNPPA
ncbi:MAG TPA: alpha/beta fold hydrolase [Brevundimonas sp.]|uniref:alpha/beta hydrolase family protein n=1 Tax=Brevundimonas sp. TaxID=1871086 RepID=UPI002DE9C800|nr:alpha/beta fold hydrolase [Brevundimonas sp.]